VNPHNRKYWAIIVHHGEVKQTQSAVKSLYQSQVEPHQIIIIDNDPIAYPADSQSVIIRTGSNLGYAGAINIGLGLLAGQGASAEDIVICLNNDVIFSAHTTLHILDWWDEHPEPAILGIATKEPTGVRTGAGHINLITGRSHPHLQGKISRSPRLSSLPYIHGACFAATLGTLLDLQGLPEQYFLYWEDAHLGFKARQLGISLHTLPHTFVTHAKTKDNMPQPDQLYYLVRNGALFLEGGTPAPWRAYWWAVNRLRLGYHTLRRDKPEVRQALQHAVQGKTGRRL